MQSIVLENDNPKCYPVIEDLWVISNIKAMKDVAAVNNKLVTFNR